MEKVNKVPFNEIKNVKEALANMALEQLEIDINSLENLVVEFGYIYLRGDHYESLFKVLTDQETFYFAVQQGNLIWLQNTFSEELFQSTIQQMRTFHGDWK
ncbi:hypothetical protein KFE98_12420 [bacterium SCSIO 12741]|nr:hypothetical protein KFE98_12420 [bacterium SCSIO 12741]